MKTILIEVPDDATTMSATIFGIWDEEDGIHQSVCGQLFEVEDWRRYTFPIESMRSMERKKDEVDDG